MLIGGNQNNNKKNIALKDTKMKKIIFILTIICILFSCNTNNNEIHSFELDNSIPLYVLENNNNRILNLRILVSGGSSSVDTIEGIEDAVFSLLERGSQNYSYEAIQQFNYETQTSFSGYSRKDSASYTVNAIDYHFKKALPIFLDTFLNPSFDDKQIQLILQDYQQEIQHAKNDPMAILQKAACDYAYKNTPYEKSIIPTEQTLPLITKENLQNEHKKILNSNRITVIAVGNFNIAHLKKALNESLGKLPRSPYTPSPTYPISIQEGNTEFIFSKNAQNTAYIGEIFNYPTMTDTDYFAANIAASIYDELLFNIVREKYGDCYSIASGAIVAKEAFGLLYAIKANNTQAIFTHIDEAKKLMSQGLTIQEKNNTTKDFTYIPYEQRLNDYKNSYLTNFYSGLQTNSALASHIATGLIISNNPLAYKEYENQILSVKAEDIKRVFEKYWIKSPKKIFIISDKNK